MAPEKRILVLVILIALALNAFTFCLAFPQAFQLPKSATYARDFSAYYIGEWRLLHNPAEIYYGGAEPGDYQILPVPQTFKYAPSFLILFAPFLTLSYQNALAAFDILQFALIPALAFFVYKLVKGKNLVYGSIAAVIVLIDPLGAAPISYHGLGFLHIPYPSLNAQSFSPSYFFAYQLGNAHALQTILLVGALYFGFAKKPWISALLFSFGAFDPRAALLALPLLIWYNRQVILKFAAGAAVFLAVTNLPFFFYFGIGFTFLHSEVNGNIAAQIYPYDLIPLFSVAALTILEVITVASNQKMHFNFLSNRKTKNTEPTQNR
ncbi:MAG: hypothetical protein ABSG33_09810 [Candidatus Bathyarchaeia archaeon]